jgi:hypothetical protein
MGVAPDGSPVDIYLALPSGETLAHVEGAEAVLADVFSLHLGSTFDAVLAGSHFINTAEIAQRQEPLSALAVDTSDPRARCSSSSIRPPGAAAPTRSQSGLGPVGITFDPVVLGDGWFRGRVS